MEGSDKFLSIDEQAKSNRSIDQKEAVNNLKHLQKHIFQPKPSDFLKCCTKSFANDVKSSINEFTITTTSVRPSSNDLSISESKCTKLPTFEREFPSNCYNFEITESKTLCNSTKNITRRTSAMDVRQEMTLPGGKATSYSRQPSVNDDELFGYGKSHPTENQGGSNNGSTANQYDQNSEQVDDNLKNLADNVKSENLDNENSCLPNFGLLESSSGSESESAKSPKSFKSMEGTKDPIQEKEVHEERHNKIEFSDGQDSSFKMRFHEKRSISAIDRRKNYRISSGGEVFDPDLEYIEDDEFIPRRSIVQSNSLPDLVTSSNQSPFSPQRFNSNPNPRPAVEENFEKQHKLKKMVEGISSMPLSKDKPKIRRSVSIKEEPEYIPAEKNDTAEDDENPIASTKETGESSTKETEERRRILSSGYGTASSEAGSQDKSEITTSRQTSQLSQSSSGVWNSQEAGFENDISDIEKAIEASIKETSKADELVASNLSVPSNGNNTNINRSSPLSFVSGGNDSSSTESSVKTVCENQDVIDNMYHASPGSFAMSSHAQMNDKSSAGELPILSIMGTSNGNKNSSGKFNRLLSKDENYGARSKIPPSVEFKPPESFEPQSHGNLPNFSTMEDSSFILKPTSIVKVQKEDDDNHKLLVQRYITDGASLGVGQQLQCSMPTFSPGSSISNRHSPSEAVKRLEEILLGLGLENLSPSIIDKMGQDIFSLSPNINNEREKIEGAGSQNFKDFTLDELKRASRCNYQACKEACCHKMRDIMRVLNLDIPHLDSSYALVKKYYMALYQHEGFTCDETKCPILFCTEFSEWVRQYHNAEDPVKRFVEDVQGYFRNPTMKLFLKTSYKFHKLQNYIQKEELNEFETHVPMFPLGKFGTQTVCKDNKLQKLVVLTYYPLMESDHQLSLYTRLKALNHAHIVPQFWMLEYDEKIQVCSLFCQGGSLEEYLSNVGALSWQRAFYYMRQILQAVIHLNNIKVVYLNWKSGNMLFPDDRRKVIQVGNFSLSCPVKCRCDIGSVLECLPFNICPPELFELQYKADCKSDIWGAGCLLYEMLAGTPFLHEYRHEEGGVVHSQIRAGSLPNTDSLGNEIKNILNSCWKMKMEDRPSLETIMRRISKPLRRR